MATDNFNSYAASSTLAGQGSWTVGNGDFIVIDSGGGDMVVQSNTAGDNTLLYWAGTFADDQYSQSVIEAEDSGNSIGVGVRISGSGASVKGYGIEINSGNWYLFKVTNGTGTWTQLDSGATSGWVYPLILRIEAEGTTIRAFSAGSQIASVTDSSLTSGNPGIVGYNDTSNNAVAILNDWDGNALGPVFTLDQEGFRWRNDDGSETTATWAAAQDTNISVGINESKRIRIVVDATEDPDSIQYRLEYKLSTDSVWEIIVSSQPTEAIPTFVGKGTFTSGTGALSVPAPASGLENDDVLLLFVESANQVIATPSGWTEVANSPQSTGTAATAGGVRLAVFYKVTDGTEANTSVADTGNHTAAIIMAFRGVDTTTPIHVSSGAVDASATTAISAPEVTTTITNCLIVNAIGLDKDLADTDTLSSVANASLSDVTEQHDQTIAGGVGGGIAVITGGKATAGASGNTTATGDSSTTHAYLTLALAPSTPVAHPVLLSTSTNIAASGEATTAQLTAPSGKTTSDFVAGRIQDDENPTDAIDIGLNQYTELEWPMLVTSEATVGEIYQLRVTKNGTVFDTYTVTPQLTVAASNTSPATPTCTAASTGTTTADLASSAFSDSDGGDTHEASQWQVTTSADTGFASPVVDSGEDAVNLVTYSATGLTASTEYIARVRHKDDSADASTEWSTWSAASDPFTTSAADSTAPVLSSPTATPASSTTVDGTVSTDEANGTLYWVVTTSSTAPTALQIRNGQNDSGGAAVASGNQAVSATGVQNVSESGLTNNTTYWFHYHHRDSSNNDSNIVSATFTTLNAPTATIDSPVAGTVSEGMTIFLSGTATAGSGTITSRQWSSNIDGVLGATDDLQVILSGTNASPVTHILTYSVTDDNSETGTDTVSVNVGIDGSGSGFDIAAYAISALGGIR